MDANKRREAAKKLNQLENKLPLLSEAKLAPFLVPPKESRSMLEVSAATLKQSKGKDRRDEDGDGVVDVHEDVFGVNDETDFVGRHIRKDGSMSGLVWYSLLWGGPSLFFAAFTTGALSLGGAGFLMIFGAYVAVPLLIYGIIQFVKKAKKK